MDSSRRSSIAIGLLLLLAGVFFLVSQFYQPFGAWVEQNLSWPWIIIGVGAILFVFSIFFRQPELMTSACVVGGIGGLLYWQNMTGNWGSWAYAWALIPGFSGIGMLLGTVLAGGNRSMAAKGLEAIVGSAVLFLIFGSFLGGFKFLGVYWPLVLVGAGLLMIIRSFLVQKPQ